MSRRMLPFWPDCADVGFARNDRLSAARAAIPPIDPVSGGCVAKDLNSAGTIKDASLLTAEKG